MEGSHIIEQNSNWSTQRHVVHDLLGADVLIVFVLHKDRQKAVRLPWHFLCLRRQHAHAADVLLEAELYGPWSHRILGFIALRGDEGVNLLGLIHDENTHISFAVVAHLASAVHVPHVAIWDVTEWTD